MKNYSYISLLTNDTYIYGLTLLVESMKKVKTKYPLHVLVTDGVSEASKEILKQLDITYENVENISMSQDLYNYNYKIQPQFTVTWKNCFTKFKVFNLTKFEKIIFLDADIMLLKNLDHLFKMPHMTAAVDGEYFSLWPDGHFNAGCMVIEPSEQEFNNLINFINNIDINNLPPQVVADQEILNLYYKDWPQKTELHLNKYYNIFAPYIQDSMIEDIEKNCYFIHYIGRKPWVFWIKNPEENYTEYFYEKAKKIIEVRIQKINWPIVRDKLVLTSYAICKNEVDNVEKWLKGFGQADYVCILDTGSTDGTWEKLQEMQKQYPNLIIDQKIISPWRFDVARNESMRLIPKESVMCFMADLDEEIRTLDWVKEVKSHWDPLFTRAAYDYHRDVLPGDIIKRTIQEFRIHSREWTHWENIVHECLVTDAGQRQFYYEVCTPVNIEVWHYPKEQKEVSYAELCEEDLKENPQNWLMRLQLAIEYEIKEQDDDALKHFTCILKNDSSLQTFEKARCWFGLARIAAKRQNNLQALNFYREGRLTEPTFADNYIAAAEIYYNDEKFAQAIDLCLEALKNCEKASWCSVYDVRTYYIYQLLGLSYYFKGEKLLGLAYMSIASVKNPDDDNLKDIIQKMTIEIAK